MKNQYFGDVHDFIKYSLVRTLSDWGRVSTTVCWMLTEDEQRRDGRRTKYLNDPERWGPYEPKLFDFLRQAVLEQRARQVGEIERSPLLPNCKFFSRILADDATERQVYFDHLRGFARDSTIVFFDPDNGLEIKSVPYGKSRSSKYLYLREIDGALEAGHSLLIYQHLPYKPRVEYVKAQARALLRSSGCGEVFAIRNGQVAFFVVPHRSGLESLRWSVRRVRRQWEGVLTVSHHTAS